MSYLDMRHALGLTETKLATIDSLIKLSKKVGGKLTTEDLEALREGIALFAQNQEMNLLRGKADERN